jgi:hypothetical protein
MRFERLNYLIETILRVRTISATLRIGTAASVDGLAVSDNLQRFPEPALIGARPAERGLVLLANVALSSHD